MVQHTIHPLLNKKYSTAVRAEGIYIFDAGGKAYIDGSSGAVTCSLGHSHPRVIKAMKKQLDKLQFVYRSQFGSRESEYLSELLSRISPHHIFDYSFFVNSGSEAIETAIKIALQYWQEMKNPSKIGFIKRRKSYHGITLGALSLSGNPVRRARFEHSLLPYITLESDLENSSLDEQMQELEEKIRIAGPHTIAAVVAEPIVGAAGTALTPKDGYYQKIRTICDRYDILFISDEVMTGIGRTGKWFGMNHWETRADLIAVGKSLGAGYAPVAAVMVPDYILDPIKRGSGLIMSGHTYSGHPLSCAAASTVIETIIEEDLLKNVNETGNALHSRLIELKNKYDYIFSVRGKGMMLGMEFDPGIEGLQKKCVDGCFHYGLLVYPSYGGDSGDIENGILIAPPYITTLAQVDAIIEILSQVLDEINNTI